MPPRSPHSHPPHALTPHPAPLLVPNSKPPQPALPTASRTRPDVSPCFSFSVSSSCNRTRKSHLRHQQPASASPATLRCLDQQNEYISGQTDLCADLQQSEEYFFFMSHIFYASLMYPQLQ
ncbi:hypothetical protein PTTG_04907 [Puccinia triticina 1-1 BBBD Race 1]|uniref:Uncharacterized protein n=1 Tax=Puccinia triticina (isolate 1-1 / race 1 (BBBD)) TaxID=630390 RepID=A0A180GTZ1_PUCT1|nr:hypothetical protein PTTG_04907 [Puccinia triticina 1-1 BBBD Race 1]